MHDRYSRMMFMCAYALSHYGLWYMNVQVIKWCAIILMWTLAFSCGLWHNFCKRSKALLVLKCQEKRPDCWAAGHHSSWCPLWNTRCSDGSEHGLTINDNLIVSSIEYVPWHVLSRSSKLTYFIATTLSTVWLFCFLGFNEAVQQDTVQVTSCASNHGVPELQVNSVNDFGRRLRSREGSLHRNRLNTWKFKMDKRRTRWC